MSYKIKPTQTPVPFAIRQNPNLVNLCKKLDPRAFFYTYRNTGHRKNQSNSFFFYIINLIGYINSLTIGQNTHIKKYFYTT